MSGLFGSITIKGNRLTDLVGQTSTVGKPIPFGYGRVRVEEANVIWTAGIPKEHVKKKKQGKGGVKTEEYTYTLSYAIAFMAGPVYGFLTIKRGGKVVYTNDPNASVDDKAFAAKWLQKARLYLGTEEQMPDATIESYKGAGKVSAHRGLCYIVVTDDDVTGEGGAVPQYEAVIIATPPDVYVTSRPYPNDMAVEGVTGSTVIDNGAMKMLVVEPPADAVEGGAVVDDGELRTIFHDYALTEATETGAVVTDGEMKTTQRSTTYPTEAVQATGGTVIDGTMKQALYSTTIPTEAVQATGATIINGSLGP